MKVNRRTGRHSRGDSKTECKSLQNRLKSGKRLNRILQNQHEIRPFTHEFVLRFRDEIDHKRFRRRLSLFLDGTIHVVLKYEESSQPHYHGIVYSESEDTEESLRAAILKSLAADVRHELDTGAINLHFNGIDEEGVHGLFFYTAKASVDLLKKAKAQVVGAREVFRFGDPFSKPTQELAKLTPKNRFNSLVNWLCKQPDVVGWILDGFVDPHHKRFLWMAYTGRDVSQCRYPIEACPQLSDFSSGNTRSEKPERFKRGGFTPRPPEDIIGIPVETKDFQTSQDLDDMDT